MFIANKLLQLKYRWTAILWQTVYVTAKLAANIAGPGSLQTQEQGMRPNLYAVEPASAWQALLRVLHQEPFADTAIWRALIQGPVTRGEAPAFS